MTIAIHLYAGSGSLLTATDTQETYGSQIVEGGKIAGLWRADPLGCINIAGAGDAPYIDALTQDIVRQFSDFRGNANEWEALLRDRVREFYDTYILPVVGRFQDENVPAYKLLIASRHDSVSKLWTTTDALMTEQTPFDCVGIGTPTALSLLNRLYPMYPTLDSVAVLAAYVIYRVKTSVEGCGLNTEIRFIHQDRIGIAPSDLIQSWEAIFRRHDRLEREVFCHTMNFLNRPTIPMRFEGIGFIEPQMRPLADVIADIERMQTEISGLSLFRRLTSGTSESA